MTVSSKNLYNEQYATDHHEFREISYQDLDAEADYQCIVDLQQL
jgi:hypothetical protein